MYAIKFATIINIGALVIVALKAAPAVIANIQALVYYVKTFGVMTGIEMYRYLGAQSLPNGILSMIQTDMSDGDLFIDDLTVAVTNDLLDGDTITDDIICYARNALSDGDTAFDDVILGTYNNLRKIYKGTGVECHHLIEKRFLSELKKYVPDLKESQFLSMPLSPQAHQVFTKAWRNALPYGGNYKLEEIINATQIVYQDYPTILEAVNNWLKSIGVIN